MELNEITEVELRSIVNKLSSKVTKPVTLKVSSSYNYVKNGAIVIKSHKVYDDKYTTVKICTI